MLEKHWISAPKIQPYHAHSALELCDGHAEPYAQAGDFAFYNEDDREPEHGAAFVTLTDSGQLFVVRAWQRASDGTWFARAPNTRRLAKTVGPMTREFFRSKIRGRLLCSCRFATR